MFHLFVRRHSRQASLDLRHCRHQGAHRDIFSSHSHSSTALSGCCKHYIVCFEANLVNDLFVVLSSTTIFMPRSFSEKFFLPICIVEVRCVLITCVLKPSTRNSPVSISTLSDISSRVTFPPSITATYLSADSALASFTSPSSLSAERAPSFRPPTVSPLAEMITE